ncbi:cytochrome P450 [Biscogniauxia marginata]|nr:cytochrome P450 [Biscogniauxia marginata]
MALLGTYSTVPGLLVVSTVALIIWYLVSAVYSGYRLRYFRGPFLASFSYLWLARMTLSGKQYENALAVGEKYGSLARIGPNDLFTSDPELIRRMSNAKINYRKSSWYDGNRFNPYNPIMFTIQDPLVHDKVKMKVAAGYSGRDIPAFESDIDTQVINLVNLIRKKYLMLPGESELRLLDLSRVMPFLTLDVISKVSLRKEFGCIETDSDRIGFYESFEHFLPTLSLSTNIPLVRGILYSTLSLKLFGPKETDATGMGKIMATATPAVRRAFSPEAKDEKSILGSFVRNGLPQSMCESEAVFMFIAGADTTAAALRITLMYLLTTPLVYQRLKEEIAAAIRDGRASHPITNAEAGNLPYLKAVKYEGLRMRPVTMSLLAKEVPPEGDTFNGRFIPGGTSIAMNLASLLRSKALFGEDADIFRPERFLELDDEAQAEIQRNVELAFGYGRWMCAGKTIAMTELNKVYFELFREFDFQIAYPQAPMTSTSTTQFIDRGLLVKVTKAATATYAVDKLDSPGA